MHWFALTVKPQHERTVADQLAAKSLDSYVPLYRAKRRWSDRVKIIDLPLFPRYVFCRFSFDDRMGVLRIPSVTSIVGFGGTPSPVSEKEIDAVKLLVGCGLAVSPWPFLRLGEHVRIHGGLLAGLEGILTREKSGYRVVVNVEMLQRAVAVEIERDCVEVIPRVPGERFLAAEQRAY
jgi:transcription antitermination factor NusG